MADNRFLKLSFGGDENITMQDVFDQFIPSRKIQHLCIQNGWITIDGNKVRRETQLQGKELMIDLYPEEEVLAKTEEDAVSIVYEDPFVIIADKPAGIIVHEDGNGSRTLLSEVRSHYAGFNYTINQIHRLDRETSGLILFSKSPLLEPWFNRQLEERKIKRTYLAIVKGTAETGRKFTIRKPIGSDRHNAGKMIVYDKGQPAVTEVEVLGSAGGYSLFQCTLQTGRTHQIRVHLSSMGYPIVGDELYGVRSFSCKSLALCACRLEFRQPFTLKKIKTEITPPYEMKLLMNTIMKQSSQLI
ncbi:MAG: RluA family pseudouridine synthase [Erysipelotrichaceae bacterium]|nr:RluA family pseudouridine synthase [Erysipelotrichaceae bacterium]